MTDESLTGHGNDHSGDDEEGWRDKAEVFHFSFWGKLEVGGDLKKRGVLFLVVNQSIMGHDKFIFEIYLNLELDAQNNRSLFGFSNQTMLSVGGELSA